jgi:protein TonB
VKAPAPEEKPEEQKPHAPQAQIPKGRLREELVPTHEMVPDNPSAPTVATTPSTPSAPSTTVPTGEQIDAALRVMEGAARPQGAAEPSDAKDQANLAALMAREARLAKYASLKDKAASQIGRGQPPPGASKAAEAPKSEAGASVEGEAEVEVGPPKVPLSERLTTGKNAVIVEIVAGVAIAVALGFIWHAVRGLIIHPSDRPVAVAAAPVKKAVPAKAAPVVVQTPAAPVEKVAAAIPPAPVNAPAATAARPSVVASAPASKIVQPAPARSESAEETGPRVVEPPPVTEEPKPAAPVAPKAAEDIPAKILSAPQPSFPSWAKTLDVASVVKLDAVIDEKGNLGETRIVSGPRLLERAAQQAVQLWIFEPAQSDGKPAESHMVLTVEFQR